MKRSNAMYKKVMLAGLAATLTLTGATSAFAKDEGPGNGHGRGHAYGHYKFNGNRFAKEGINLDFSDMRDGRFDWALKNIARLASLGVFHGYSDGTFKPNQAVTRIEAIVAAVRLLGLEDEATSTAEMNANLNFKDADQVKKKYPQAVGYVDVALKNDLFLETDDKVEPDKPADRLWTTMLLIKALKLEDEAKAQMGAQLTFKDAREIPAGAVGYVKEALDKGLIFGYEDNTFRPKQAVTRAELAALLDRMGSKLPDYNNAQIHGTVTAAVTNNVLTIAESNGQTQQLSIDPNVFVFKNGQKVSASALQTGDVINARTYNNVVVFIEVVSSNQDNATFHATVKSVSGSTITLTRDGTDTAYTLASNALIYRGGSAVNASQLVSGDEAYVRLSDGKIALLQVTSAVDAATAFTGTLKAVNSNSVTITKSDNTDVTYSFASNAVIWRNGANVSASSLIVGDQVYVNTANSQIVFLQVTTAAQANTTLTGTVKQAVSNNQLTITKDGQDYTYTIASNASIIRNNQAVQPSALVAGDEVSVTVVNNQIIFLNVTKLANETPFFTGTIDAVNTANGTLTIKRDGVDVIYQTNSATLLYRNGVRVNLSGLQTGDEVNVLLQNGSNTITMVQVTKPVENTNQTFTVDGTFQSMTLNSTGEIATISVTQSVYNGTQTAIYNVSGNVNITGDVAQLVQGHAITLKGQNQVVTEIDIH